MKTNDMTQRCFQHDYALPGIYHLTLKVADALGQPFGQVVGDIHVPDGMAGAPHVALSPIGQMVEEELLHSIPAHYPMMEIQDYVIMPEHIHFIIEAHSAITTKNGKKATLGQVIAGFKKGCNRRYWELTSQQWQPGAMQMQQGMQQQMQMQQGKPAATNSKQHTAPAGSVGVGGPAVCPQVSSAAVPYKVRSDASSGRGVLFASGFTDVMPLRAGQLAQQREYIRNNPRTRLLRNSHRAWLYTQRGGIATALTPQALHGYLSRECGSALTEEAWSEVYGQLLIAPDGRITCDTFGDRRLLSRRLLPVVCHRRDRSRFATQKGRCLEEAARGAVLVSARIARGEQDIMDETANRGFPVVLIADNGFTDRYHPSASRMSLCAEGRLLLVTPWRYEYRRKDDSITVAACKTMNCISQALCRTRDSWWRTS